MKKSILLVIYVLVASNLFSQKLILSFNLPVGTKYSTEFDILSTVNQIIMGIEQEAKINMLLLIDSEVVESNSEYNLVEVSYKKFSIETSNAMFSFSIDSHGKDDNPSNSIYRSVIDKSFFVKINKSGEIINIEGLNQIIMKIIEEIPPEDPLFENYKKTLVESFGENSLKQNYQQFSAVFPDNEVGVNDNWNFNSSSKATEFETQIFNTATVKSITASTIIVQINSIIASTGEEQMEMEGMKGQITLTGSQVSEIHINPSTGMSKSGVVNQKIEGELKLTSIENQEETFSIPMKISSKIQIKNSIK